MPLSPRKPNSETSLNPAPASEQDDAVPQDRSAGVPPAVAGASRPRFGTVTIRNRGRLPHWTAEEGVYFVTFRLRDSLPRHILEVYKSERTRILNAAKQQSRAPGKHEKNAIAQLFNRKIEDHLDAGSGKCLLARPQVTQLTADALKHFNGKRYRLFAWCVMPNHVHVVMRTIRGWTLDAILHSWKSFTAKEANRILGRDGAFWQREYHDHLVRDEDDFRRVCAYVKENPSNAGLRNWEWVWVDGLASLPPADGAGT